MGHISFILSRRDESFSISMNDNDPRSITSFSKLLDLIPNTLQSMPCIGKR